MQLLSEACPGLSTSGADSILEKGGGAEKIYITVIKERLVLTFAPHKRQNHTI